MVKYWVNVDIKKQGRERIELCVTQQMKGHLTYLSFPTTSDWNFHEWQNHCKTMPPTSTLQAIHRDVMVNSFEDHLEIQRTRRSQFPHSALNTDFP